MNEDLENVSKDSLSHLCSGGIQQKDKAGIHQFGKSISRNLVGQVSFAGGIWERRTGC